MIKNAVLIFAGFLLLGLNLASTSSSVVNRGSLSITLDGNSVSGNVTLPSSVIAQRSFRGRAYRNRGNTTSNNQKSESSNNNPLIDTIISLHPMDYKMAVEPLVEPSIIQQKDAEFIPNVTPVTVGSIVQFLNDDPFYHNVFSLTPGARFNIGRRPTGDIYEKKIPATSWKVEGLGEIQLFCDIHSQMNAVILSLDTPYYTRVNESGDFSIENIPDGEYELRAYHPRHELDSQVIFVKNEQKLSLDINFSN